MSKFRSEQIRNIVLIGHGAVGKTSLADRMLYQAGAAPRPGSVDDGTSQLDTDEEARHRHFSISSAMAHLEHRKLRINLIDTPGYPDFVGQAISAVCAAETAVITLSGPAGIEANTRKAFDLAGRAQLARMLVINKLDQEAVDLPALLDDIQTTFGRNCVPLNLPNDCGSNFTATIDTLNIAPASDRSAAASGFNIDDMHARLVDAIVEADEELMLRFLDGEMLQPDEILGGVTKAIAVGTLIPVFCLSAKTGVGVEAFMDAIADFALSPGELVRHARDTAGSDVTVAGSEEAPLVAQVFKTRIDPFVSKMSFIRVFSGKLTKDAVVRDSRTGKGVKLHQLLDVQGGQVEQIEEAHAGDLVAVAKIDDFQIGDTLTSNGDGWMMPTLDYPTPMIGLAVEPKSRADQQKISGALHKIEEEDPTFRVTRDPQTHEMVMRGMSELHLQIVQEVLHKRDKVDVLVHPPKVPYRETCSCEASGFYRHKKQTGGAGQFAEVHLRVIPLPQGLDRETYFTRARFEGLRATHYDADLNFAFLDCVSGGSVPNQFIPAVEKGVRERMEQGVLAGYQVQDLAVALFFGKDHPVDSNENAFRTAASQCFKGVFLQARPVLLEPMMKLDVTAGSDRFGEISSDLTARRGRMEGMDTLTDGSQLQIHAVVPLAEMATYGRTLSSLTAGQGTYSLQFEHYEQVPPPEQAKLVAVAQQHHAE